MSIETIHKTGNLNSSSAPSGLIFRNEDLRSKKFDGLNLRNAIFDNCILGISTTNRLIIFLIAVCLSLFAGYIAMLSGSMVQVLLTSVEPRLRLAGYIICGLFLVFTAIAIWRGLHYTSIKVATAMIILIIVIGLTSYFTHASTAGIGALYGVASLLLMFIMFIIGSVARATAGSLQSTLLFMIVAMGGGLFAKSLGGGIGTLIMTVTTVIISKKALKSDNPSLVKYIALRISTAFGTSFKNVDLSGASFSTMVIKNCDFSDSTLEDIKLEDVTESLCYYGGSTKKITDSNPPK